METPRSPFLYSFQSIHGNVIFDLPLLHPCGQYRLVDGVIWHKTSATWRSISNGGYGPSTINTLIGGTTFASAGPFPFLATDEGDLDALLSWKLRRGAWRRAAPFGEEGPGSADGEAGNIFCAVTAVAGLCSSNGIAMGTSRRELALDWVCFVSVDAVGVGSCDVVTVIGTSAGGETAEPAWRDEKLRLAGIALNIPVSGIIVSETRRGDGPLRCASRN